MAADNWEQFKGVFDAALQLSPDKRAAYLTEVCPEPAVRTEVESLLVCYAEAMEATEKLALKLPAPRKKSESYDDLIERFIDHYQIIARLEQKGVETVYGAIRIGDGGLQPVCLRLIRDTKNTEEFLRRYRRQRFVFLGLEHPNIARILDAGATKENWPYIVTEPVDGTCIGHYCDSKKLSLRNRVKLFLDVCHALQYAHQHFIPHRSLNMENILVTADGIPKVLNLGVWSLLDDGQSPKENQDSGNAVEYRSPAQARGEPVTARDDVYSLGVIFYRLLCGLSPVSITMKTKANKKNELPSSQTLKPSKALKKGADKTADFPKINFEKISRLRGAKPSTLRRQLAGDLDSIAVTATQSDTKGYSSVADFHEDIRRYLRGLPVMARKHTLLYRAGKFIRRNKLRRT